MRTSNQRNKKYFFYLFLGIIESCEIFLNLKESSCREETLGNLTDRTDSALIKKLLSSNTLTTEQSISSRTKTPAKNGRNEKSVGKNRDQSQDKDKLVKMKTMSNLKNFAATAKNIKNENKLKTNSQISNKSSIFNSGKEGSTTIETTSKNKTFVIEKNDLKKEKSKSKLNLNDTESKSARDKLNKSTLIRKESGIKPISHMAKASDTSMISKDDASKKLKIIFRF